jgi:virginiamycin B lyase
MSRSPIRFPSPTRLALLVGALALLALPASATAYVYWGNGATSAVGRASLDGSAPNQSFITGATGVDGVAVDAQNIYWADTSGTIGRANLDGTGVDQSFIPAANDPAGVAVDASHVYWVNAAGDAIARANIDGTGANLNFIPIVPSFGGEGVAVDSQHIYWTNSSGAIGRANLDGTGVDQSFISGAGQATGIAVDSQHIYWTIYGNGVAGAGAVARANLDGTGSNLSFITGGAGAWGVAVDSSHVYWANFIGETIGAANLDGTAVNQSLITGASDPEGVAVDPLPLPPPVAHPPGTRITRSKISSKKHRARFRFKAIGTAHSFQCELKRAHHKKPRARYRRCSSPKTYKHLKHGTYVFKVRAKGADGVDPTPAKKKFRIK